LGASTIVFHPPQPAQRPDHASASWPHSWQKKADVAFGDIVAIVRTAPDGSTGACADFVNKDSWMPTPRPLSRAALLCAALATLAIPAAAIAFDPSLEAKNFAKTAEREQYITLTPEFQLRLQQANLDNETEVAQIVASDPERNFSGNVCANGGNECAGDVRFYDWDDQGFAIRKPVLFTARNGSTLSGHVWATRDNSGPRPGVVITTGSVQAPEQLYWGTAAVLAKHGYVVLTYDTQGQGRSDTFGEGVDMLDGVPSQTGEPFYDGTEDALDFLLSTPAKPYDPRPSCSTGTDHSAKQDRRVASGLNAAYNPLNDLVDPKRIGIAGHSLGAAAVSYIGQLDPRVDAIAAWDNLRAPSASQAPGSGPGGPPTCASGSSERPTDLQITKPAIGISNDYGIAPSPNTGDPDPQTGNDGFLAYKDAGVDSMEFHIRGGTHEESAFIPGNTTGVLGLASLRGTDMIAWYTTAWFEKYVKGAEGGNADIEAADRAILTDRWRDDERGGSVDTNGDANLYSFYRFSRYDLHSGGKEVTCDDMRSGCDSMRPDGFPAGYSLVADAYTAPLGAGGGGGTAGGGDCVLSQLGTDAKDTAETLPPSGAGDAIRGRGGDDSLRGGDGNDCLYGNAGSDKLAGDAGKDRLKGGKDDDRLSGGAGRDVIGGGPGADTIRARDGARDRIRCGPGKDEVIADRKDKLGAGC
jgi:dienelactone hydrolase